MGQDGQQNCREWKFHTSEETRLSSCSSCGGGAAAAAGWRFGGLGIDDLELWLQVVVLRAQGVKTMTQKVSLLSLSEETFFKRREMDSLGSW